jgi:endonuclease YncB( thermonuclease family)
MVILALIGLVALVAMVFQPDPVMLSGRATATDGDSLRLNGERVRLLGIDAPEFDQTCTDGSGIEWKCGQAARKFLADALSDKVTRCETDGRDRYGRYLARCNAESADIGELLVAAGLAVTDGSYLVAQTEARIAGRGVWQGPFDDPADWRAHHGETESFDLIGWLKGLIGSN